MAILDKMFGGYVETFPLKGDLPSLSGLPASPQWAMKNGVVRACVQRIAHSIAGMDFQCFYVGSKQLIRQSDTLSLLHRPSAFISSYDFWYAAVERALIYGYADVRLSGDGKSLNLQDPPASLPTSFPSAGPGKIILRGLDDGQGRPVMLSQLLQKKLSILDAIETEIGKQLAAGNLGKTYLKRTTRDTAAMLNGENKDTIVSEAMRSFEASQMGYLGLDFDVRTTSQELLKFREQKQSIEDDIAAVFGFTRAQISEKQTNGHEDRTAFEAVMPWSRRLCSALTLALSDGSFRVEQDSFYFRLQSSSPSERVGYLSVLRQLGCLSANEVRDYEGLGTITGMDTFVMNQTWAPQPEQKTQTQNGTDTQS